MNNRSEIMGLIEWFSDRDNITLAIAIAGFLLSVYTLLLEHLKNRMNLRVSVGNVFRIQCGDIYSDVLHIKVENRSKLPIILSKIVLRNHFFDGNKAFQAYQFGNKWSIIVAPVKAEPGDQCWHANVLPMRIDGYGCCNLFFTSDTDSESIALGQFNLLSVYTNKRTIHKKVRISCFSPLSQLTQYREPD